MADIDVKNTSSRSTERQGANAAGTRVQRQTGSGGQPAAAGDPFAFSLNPSEFFSNPFGAMRRMSEEMDRTFNQLLSSGGPAQGASGRAAGWYPAIEIAENNGQLQVHAELPGLRPEDVNVEVTEDTLVIHGERKFEQENREGNVVRSERRYGRFYREIPLPEGVNADQVRAQFRNGVLEVTVPVQQQSSRRRQIPVQSGEAISAGTGTTGGAASNTAAAGSASAGGAGTSQVNAGSSGR